MAAPTTEAERTPGGLAAVLTDRRREILEQWMRAERGHPPGRLPAPELLDHIPHLLARIARAAARGEDPTALQHERVDDGHALERLGRGFELEEVLREYARLRDAIVEVWRPERTPESVRELLFLERALAATGLRATAEHTRSRERTLRALDDISRAALEARDGDELVRRLLLAFIDTSEAADAALVLSAEGGELRLAGDVGFGAALSEWLRQRFQALVEEGGWEQAAGLEVMDRLGADVLSASGIRGVYTATLLEGRSVLGLAVMASRTAERFSRDDRLVFDAMTGRAAMGLMQHHLRTLAARRARHEAAIAELGLRALASASPGEVAREAVQVLARELDCEIAFVLERTADGEALALVASVGLDEGLRPGHRLELGADRIRELARAMGSGPLESAAGALPSELSSLVEGRDLRCGLTAALGAPSSTPAADGVLGAYSSHRCALPEDDAIFVRAVANVVSSMMARARVEEERSRLLRTVEEERARLSGTLEQLPEAVWLAEAPTGRIVPQNRMAREVASRFPVPPERIDRYERIAGLHPDGTPYRPEEWPLARSLLWGEVVVDEEIEVRGANGSRAVILVRSSPLRSPSGEIVGALGTTTEITERKLEEERARYLAEATRQLSASLDPQRTLQTIASLAVPRVADWCTVHLLKPDASLDTAAVAHTDPARRQRLRELLLRYPAHLGSPGGAGYVVRTGEPQLVSDVSDEMWREVAEDEEHERLLRELGLRSYMGVPLAARGEVFGALVFINSESPKRFDERDLAFAEELGRRCALAIDNARLFQKEQLSRRWLEGIISQIVDAVLVSDRAGRFVLVNDSAARLFGVPREQLMTDARAFISRFRPQRPGGRSNDAFLGDVFRGEVVGPEEQRLRAADGTERWVRASAAPLFDDRGEIDGAVVVGGDITASKAIEAELSRAEEDARYLSEVSRVLAESLDVETLLRSVARLALPRLADLFVVLLLGEEGAPLQAVVEGVDEERARTFERLLREHGVRLEEGHPLAQILQRGRAELVEQVDPQRIRAAFPDPGVASAIEAMGFRSFAGFPLLARGRILGGIGLLSTDPRRAFGERERRIGDELARRVAVAVDNARLYREAQEAARMREQILAVVSHDLKNPLAAVQMNAQLLRRSAAAEGGRIARTADTIVRACDRMTRMINDLVDLRSIQRGRLTVEKQPSALGAILEEACDEAGALVRQRDIRVHTVVPDDMPLVPTDRQRLLQVLSNLLANAASASRPGDEIDLGAEPRRDEVLVWVRDQGKGIPPEEMGHLFEPYRRGHDATYKGAGLGLAISRGIIAAHGGRIWAESEVGRGTTFFFTLPLEEAEPTR